MAEGEELIEDLPLSTMFEQAQQIHSRSCTSQLELDELRKGCRLLEECQMKIDKFGLFSANEEKEDIATTHLKYLLVPYYLGELMEKLPNLDRLELLKLAHIHLQTFVRSCECLELVPDSELQNLSRECLPDAATRRAEKIARFKRQKAAEEKLQEIKEHKDRKRRSTQAAASGAVFEYGEENLADEDEEEEREAWFMQISLALCKVFDLLEMLHREEEMLAAIKEEKRKVGKEALTRELLDERHAKAEAWHRDASSKAKSFKPVKAIACASFAQDVIEGRANLSEGHQHAHQSVLFGPATLSRGSITTERERISAQVFQPSYRLPTMSIEEAGLREMEIMQKWTERNSKLQEEAKSSWVDDQSKQDGSDDEAAENKSRAWDDWKDEHPRGAGNKKLTPCG
ncbi:hypothetical protein O6H91_23G066200 [Diphasiastrum complanatum]|uniref:Uncharacterized protein n=4 Tax=Diphasiastrum complanatum TaxID=34168 RepID=A0ACC2ABQ0_DIPCM|nr:hypothetical protein O6H91_23G066200 [Diphasiastrum complanatum]KAJ7514943.1 hypothetical protein O6H91_23G066200 [Diphasiastrum complanatum]KAJ7514944.1 hypothetical protein O6H91_23G066200 [Diphasiastrum complanatum]KAJ7514945.1 hypothetical protein O6H91_23G066200 [Diphasiastrum complanatum]